MFKTREEAEEIAKQDAREGNVCIGIVNDPYSEDLERPYNYAPFGGCSILFPYGLIESVVDPDGTIRITPEGQKRAQTVSS